MGTSLLIRIKRQVTLTKAGILFQQRAEEIVSLVEKTIQDIVESRQRDTRCRLFE